MGETNNKGYIAAQSYATNPTGEAPTENYHEFERGIDAYALEQAGEAAKLASAIDVTGGGQVLIGPSTFDSNGDAGVGVAPTGIIYAIRDNATPMTLNRLNGDGTIAEFKHDDVVEGDIRTAGATLGLNGTSQLAMLTAGSERARVDASGNLLVGKTSASLATVGFEIQQSGVIVGTRSAGRCGLFNRTVDDGTILDFMQNDSIEGSISISGSTTAYNTTSDYRKKENVTDLTGATERIKQIPVRRFNFIGKDATVDGFLAHEVQAVVPEAVQGEKDAMHDVEVEVTPAVLDEHGNVVTPAVTETQSQPKYQQIDQSKLVPLLVATIKELEARITALEA